MKVASAGLDLRHDGIFNPKGVEACEHRELLKIYCVECLAFCAFFKAGRCKLVSVFDCLPQHVSGPERAPLLTPLDRKRFYTLFLSVEVL